MFRRQIDPQSLQEEKDQEITHFEQEIQTQFEQLFPQDQLETLLLQW
ncbi:MAG: hypothetical protein GXP45_06205 [bacterium]|nr:hypothetical protein [bacterium]